MEVEMSSSRTPDSEPDGSPLSKRHNVDSGPDDDLVPVKIEYGANEDETTVHFSWKRLLMFAGPGLLMSIAYVDPGNLESDLQTGFSAGYSLGWLIAWSTFIGFIVQLLAVRLGIATKKHLAEQCRAVYPPVPRTILWLMTEVAIIGSDIQEVIGSAIAIQLLSGGSVPLWAGVLVTGLDTFFLLYLERLGVRKLEAFFGMLVATMTVSFGVMYYKAECPIEEVARGALVPYVQFSQLSVAVGIVGALVMPHNIFLHSALVQSRKIDMDHTGAKKEAILYNAIESGFSLLVTVFINIFVMAVFAAGFHGRDDIDEVGLSTAGRHLGERYGDAMKYIWALGLLAAGQSSTMTGTYTGQFVMSGFMDLHVSAWLRAAITRGVALVPTLAVALIYAGTNKMDALNQGLNVVQSIQLPFALIPVLYITSREDIMGEHFVVRNVFRTCVYTICAFLLTINLSVVASSSVDTLDYGWLAALLTPVFIVLYMSFIAYLLIGPRRVHSWFATARNPVLSWLADIFGNDVDLSVERMPVSTSEAMADDLPLVGGALSSDFSHHAQPMDRDR